MKIVSRKHAWVAPCKALLTRAIFTCFWLLKTEDFTGLYLFFVVQFLALHYYTSVSYFFAPQKGVDGQKAHLTVIINKVNFTEGKLILQMPWKFLFDMILFSFLFIEFNVSGCCHKQLRQRLCSFLWTWQGAEKVLSFLFILIPPTGLLYLVSIYKCCLCSKGFVKLAWILTDIPFALLVKLISCLVFSLLLGKSN